MGEEPGVDAPSEVKREPSGPPQNLHAALAEALADPLRGRVYVAVTERPGATIAQIATRIGEPPRRVRHQIERLVEVGLVTVDSESARRNARERHYRAIVVARITDDVDAGWEDEQRRKIAQSVARLIMSDVARAVRGRTFGNREGHVEVRIPGEVDQRGWEKLAAIMARTTEEIEATMIESAARLEQEGRPGIEVVSALLLFEGTPWEEPGERREAPRPNQWRAEDRARLR